MIAPVFVDANIFVYGIDAAAGRKHQLAAEWIGRLWSERLGRTSVQVLSEYYVTVTRKLKPAIAADEAWRDVNVLMAWKPQAMASARARTRSTGGCERSESEFAKKGRPSSRPSS